MYTLLNSNTNASFFLYVMFHGMMTYVVGLLFFQLEYRNIFQFTESNNLYNVYIVRWIPVDTCHSVTMSWHVKSSLWTPKREHDLKMSHTYMYYVFFYRVVVYNMMFSYTLEQVSFISCYLKYCIYTIVYSQWEQYVQHITSQCLFTMIGWPMCELFPESLAKEKKNN